MVSGYTFRLYCLFRRHGRDISLALEFFFTSGDFDDFCQWPFDREVVLRLAHPSDSSKTIHCPLPLSGPEAAAVFQKPGRSTSNPGFFTEEYCWDEIEAAGFVSDGILRVDVTFE
ncbi:hypothetical protein HPB48_008478 [Haemaphysalis longicornis]|uniref:TRAF1-6 MATH domain-containing protein n=1 Tax=Haemaphysalis longicornis TaxID=44386 RepID=A0A9J6FQC7_HAELO|nr:hypothetical protein HPB48_008478 [Haemaphysalis longicornis]